VDKASVQTDVVGQTSKESSFSGIALRKLMCNLAPNSRLLVNSCYSLRVVSVPGIVTDLTD
jgi:hypothetical protein